MPNTTSRASGADPAFSDREGPKCISSQHLQNIIDRLTVHDWDQSIHG